VRLLRRWRHLALTSSRRSYLVIHGGALVEVVAQVVVDAVARHLSTLPVPGRGHHRRLPRLHRLGTTPLVRSAPWLRSAMECQSPRITIHRSDYWGVLLHTLGEGTFSRTCSLSRGHLRKSTARLLRERWRCWQRWRVPMLRVVVGFDCCQTCPARWVLRCAARACALLSAMVEEYPPPALTLIIRGPWRPYISPALMPAVCARS
jgi:hypothetical protein